MTQISRTFTDDCGEITETNYKSQCQTELVEVLFVLNIIAQRCVEDYTEIHGDFYDTNFMNYH